jgi:hypothetical protein
MGRSAEEYLQSPEHLLEGLLRARELYRPDGLPTALDLQLEAEILGCQLRWLDGVPPAVCEHPLASGGLSGPYLAPPLCVDWFQTQPTGPRGELWRAGTGW